ncbi:MAG: hypothetical protein P8M17_10470 [Saprospiraceae bacterium]|nr:hypothetical protein [Saprospiraceae bacterium]MDC3253926.1 hypothetical protein [bacterium]MDG1432877.1 hypothetical protein [Saprospiraceae bacterium]MDG2419406.1 hypothetical protein [Saprospiraceae bacterium]
MRLLFQISLPYSLLLFFSLLVSTPNNAKCIYFQPVKIKSTEVGNMLSWSTYKEEDNKFFVIQKSIDGINFKKAGVVKGAGNSNKIRTYRFLDLSIGKQRSYYRLLHYSADNSFTESEIFIIDKSSENNLMIKSMSSLVTDRKLRLTIKSVVETDITFKFVRTNGKVISRGKKKLTKGLNVFSFDCSKLPNGQYEVILKGNNEKEIISIRKVKTSEMPKLDYEVFKK